MFLELSQNSQENTCARVSFLIELQAWEISKNMFFTEHLRVTASVLTMQFLSFCRSKYPKFFPAGPFFLYWSWNVYQNSHALTNSSLKTCTKWLIYGLLYEKIDSKILWNSSRKIMNTQHALIFSLINLNLVKKVKKDK